MNINDIINPKLLPQIEAELNAEHRAALAESEDCTKKAVVEQYVEDSEGAKRWLPCAYEPTMAQRAAILNGDMPKREDIPPAKFGCKHEAAEFFAKFYGEMCARYLLGQEALLPIHTFRIRELDEGQ